jgi:trimethylamine--corrinoid protein Co-methyltransferase
MIDGSKVNSPSFRVLSEEQCERIHRATLKVLETVGVKVELPEGREILRKAGATVEGEIVKIPKGLVEEALKKAPSSFTVWDRLGNEALELGGRRSHFGGCASCPQILDPRTGERRPCTRADVAEFARMNDYLPNMEFIMLLGQVRDVPSPIATQIEFKETVSNTVKPILMCCNEMDVFEDVYEMLVSISGGADALAERPFLIVYTEPITPLVHGYGLEVALRSVERGLPVVNTPMPMGGATAPVTYAGIITLGTAESVSGIVMQQLVKPGAPSVFGGIPSAMDMLTTIYSYGTPELPLLCSALTDMSHYYDLPMFGTAGVSDSKFLDAQAGMEYGISALASVMCGSNLIHDTGFLDHSEVLSFEGHLLMDELAGYIRQFMKGVEVSDETLALDIIGRVGPGGTFVAEEHTFRHFRELHRAKHLDRSRYQLAQMEGMKPLDEVLRERACEILESHRPAPLAAGVQSRLDQMEKKWWAR